MPIQRCVGPWLEFFCVDEEEEHHSSPRCLRAAQGGWWPRDRRRRVGDPASAILAESGETAQGKGGGRSLGQTREACAAFAGKGEAVDARHVAGAMADGLHALCLYCRFGMARGWAGPCAH